jgi:CubicO group peptidase (beta-lactamase class C family)
MRLKKIILRVAAVLLLLAIIIGVWYAWRAFPIISGYGAKNMASAVFVQHRNPEDVMKEDLEGFPFTIGTYKVNLADSSVTGSVWGFAKRKAIYRTGLGCTLINDISEDEIRKQQFDLPSSSKSGMDSIQWPVGDRTEDSLPPGIDTVKLQLAISNAIEATSEGKPAHTRAVLVVYDGVIVGEKYAPGFDQHSLMLGWSVSKSLIAAMIGILVKEGRLNPDAPAPVPEWKGTSKEKITLKQLLQQTNGLKFKEDYSGPSEVTNMLFKRGEMAAYTADLSLKHEPGSVFNYSSGNSNILSRIIRHVVGEKSYPAFPYQALFHKLSMYSMLLEPDASGTYIASSYSYATARDFARFGLLYYNNGSWNGEQILPENWVKESTISSSADKRRHYGYQFWLNGFPAGDSTRRWYPDVPADMYFADGYGGQDIYIIPSKKLVIVRLGLHVIDENKFLREVVAAVTSR